MQVVVYEPQFTGHHLAYLAHMLPALAELPCTVTWATTDAAVHSDEYQLHLAHLADRFRTATDYGVANPVGRAGLSTLADGLRRCIHELRPAHVLAPYGDGLAMSVGAQTLRGKKFRAATTDDAPELEVLLMRGRYVYPRPGLRGAANSLLQKQLILRGPWRVVHHLDPQGVDQLRGGSAARRDRVRHMPDPAPAPATTDRVAARRHFGVPESGRFVGVAGMLDCRKGVDLVIDAFQTAQERLGDDAMLLLAGKVNDAPVRALLDGPAKSMQEAGRIVLLDRHLSDAEIDLAIAAMDLVCTPYPTHEFSASIVIRAASVSRPVLGANIAWMERTIRQFQLGATCSVTHPQEFASRLVDSLADAPRFNLTPAAKRFVQFHNPSNFVSHWTARLRERLGAPPDESRLEWDSVVRDA